MPPRPKRRFFLTSLLLNKYFLNGTGFVLKATPVFIPKLPVPDGGSGYFGAGYEKKSLMEAAPGARIEKGMSKHSFHQEKHHKEPIKDGENGGGPEEPVDQTSESREDSPGAAQAGAQDSSGNPAADGAGCPGKEAPEGGEDSGGERIAELEAQLADLKDQLLRKAADVENFRKRITREKQDAIEFANQSLLLDLIPILDDFDRAVQSAGSSKDFTALFEGVEMIAKRLAAVLDSKWGLKSYISAGTPFDPNFHEALMMEKSSAVVEQTVQIDLLKGYTLKNRVIRCAKVKVLDPDPAAPAIEAPPAPGKTDDPAEPAAEETKPDPQAEEGTAGT
jgi:molecular chaperone GrpE